MSSIAVQCAVGEVGSKATTKLSYGFSSLVNIGRFQYGMDNSGIYLLNSGETDNNVIYSRTFTLATTDLGNKNRKRGRRIYIGVDTNSELIVSIKFDDEEWRNYPVTPKKNGLQEINVPVGYNGYGRYMTVKITSNNRFRIDNIDILLIIRSLGTRRY